MNSWSVRFLRRLKNHHRPYRVPSGCHISTQSQTRKIGNIYAIDVHIKLDKNISFVKSHDVATEIEVRLRDKFGPRTITNIHTEPFEVKEKE